MQLLGRYLLQVLLEVEGDTVVGGEEDGEILRLLQSKGIHIATVQDSFCPAHTRKIHICRSHANLLFALSFNLM